jgi:Zn-finger nucleic acid-binding protein
MLRTMFNERSAAYRQSLPCPSCGHELQTETFNAIDLDVCEKCGGVFVDWTDGDPKKVMQRPLAPMQSESATQVPGLCPKCTAPLNAETIVDAIVGHRCPECVGVFFLRRDAEALKYLQPEPEADNVSLLTRLGEALTAFFDRFAP